MVARKTCPRLPIPDVGELEPSRKSSKNCSQSSDSESENEEGNSSSKRTSVVTIERESD